MKVLFIQISAVFVLLNFNKTLSQSLTFEMFGGYSISAFNDDLGSQIEEIGTVNLWADSIGNKTVKPVYGSLGKGMHVGFSMGLQTNKHFGFSIETSYFKGSSVLFGKVETTTYKASHFARSFRLTSGPLITFSTAMPKWNLYVKSGLIFPLTGKAISTVEIDDDDGRLAFDRLGFNIPGANTDVSLKAETSGQFSYGFKATLGLDLHVHNNIHVFAEANLISLNMKTKKTEITEYAIQTTVKGLVLLEETIDDLEEVERYTNYLSELNQDSNNENYNTTSFDPGLPNEKLAFLQDYSNAGLTAGIRFVMGVGKNRRE